MPKLKIVTVKSHEFDHYWNDLTLFEKLPIKKEQKLVKRDEWKRRRKHASNAKARSQEYYLGTHGH